MLLFEFLLLLIPLAVFKLPGLVAQLVPSYSSVAPVGGGVYHQKLKLLFVFLLLLNHILLCLKDY
jgi:hypothetical protein